MRQFQTSILELRENISYGFVTQPFECAWATEAIFFLHIDEPGDARLTGHVQISPDGIRWIDEGTELAATAERDGYFIRVNQFGGWLRLRFSGKGEMTATIRLALKE